MAWGLAANWLQAALENSVGIYSTEDPDRAVYSVTEFDQERANRLGTDGSGTRERTSSVTDDQERVCVLGPEPSMGQEQVWNLGRLITITK